MNKPETTPLPALNYKAAAPDNALTFSHVHHTWIASWCGNWVAVDDRDARSLFDKGFCLLDDIGNTGTPVPVKPPEERLADMAFDLQTAFARIDAEEDKS